MATIKDKIEQYLQEYADETNKSEAAQQIVKKLKGLQYSESKQPIPTNKLLEEAVVIKNANDNHLELIEAVIEHLEQED